ncbi:hypothetical protein DFJ73DRAFT_565972 [Zopfochytrium polystomum]|nr:hypothetical protein DFJ73DRAFT_565972 [Zopfochytrium polystomum]
MDGCLPFFFSFFFFSFLFFSRLPELGKQKFSGADKQKKCWLRADRLDGQAAWACQVSRPPKNRHFYFVCELIRYCCQPTPPTLPTLHRERGRERERESTHRRSPSITPVPLPPPPPSSSKQRGAHRSGAHRQSPTTHHHRLRKKVPPACLKLRNSPLPTMPSSSQQPRLPSPFATDSPPQRAPPPAASSSFSSQPSVPTPSSSTSPSPFATTDSSPASYPSSSTSSQQLQPQSDETQKPRDPQQLKLHVPHAQKPSQSVAGSSRSKLSSDDDSVSKFVIASSRVLVDASEEGLIGAGTYGVVRRALYDQHPVVVKTLILRSLSKRLATDFKREASVLSELNHPRVVRFYGCILEPGYSALVMEYLPLGSLFEIYINGTDPSDESAPINLPHFAARLQLAVDVASGMNYLHTHKPTPIFHRDLKSMNVLCENDPTGRLRAKLADFGLALVKTETMTNSMGGSVLVPVSPTTLSNRNTSSTEGDFARGPKGTLVWMAPELNNLHAKYTASCDVYSFGVLLTEIGSWAGPYTIRVDQLRFEVLKATLARGTLPQLIFPRDVPDRFREILAPCLSFSAPHRPSFAELLPALEQLQADLPFLAPLPPEPESPARTSATTAADTIVPSVAVSPPSSGNSLSTKMRSNGSEGSRSFPRGDVMRAELLREKVPELKELDPATEERILDKLLRLTKRRAISLVVCLTIVCVVVVAAAVTVVLVLKNRKTPEIFDTASNVAITTSVTTTITTTDSVGKTVVTTKVSQSTMVPSVVTVTTTQYVGDATPTASAPSVVQETTDIAQCASDLPVAAGNPRDFTGFSDSLSFPYYVSDASVLTPLLDRVFEIEQYSFYYANGRTAFAPNVGILCSELYQHPGNTYYYYLWVNVLDKNYSPVGTAQFIPEIYTQHDHATMISSSTTGFAVAFPARQELCTATDFITSLWVDVIAGCSTGSNDWLTVIVFTQQTALFSVTSTLKGKSQYCASGAGTTGGTQASGGTSPTGSITSTGGTAKVAQHLSRRDVVRPTINTTGTALSPVDYPVALANIAQLNSTSLAPDGVLMVQGFGVFAGNATATAAASSQASATKATKSHARPTVSRQGASLMEHVCLAMLVATVGVLVFGRG